MSNHIVIYTTYLTGSEFGGGLEVSKFSIKKVGIGETPNTMVIEFQGEGSIKSARMRLDPEIAVPLARNLLSVAEGYVSESVSQVA